MFFDKDNLAALHHSADRWTSPGCPLPQPQGGDINSLPVSPAGDSGTPTAVPSVAELPCLGPASTQGLKMTVANTYRVPFGTQLVPAGKNQHQALASPGCSKTYSKHLQLNQIPVEADSSARDPSTAASPY